MCLFLVRTGFWYMIITVERITSIRLHKYTSLTQIWNNKTHFDCKLKWAEVRQQITKLAKLQLLDICEDTGDGDGLTTKTSQLTLQIFLQPSLISYSVSVCLFPPRLPSLYGERYFCHTPSLNHRPARLAKLRTCLQRTHTVHTHYHKLTSKTPNTVQRQGFA